VVLLLFGPPGSGKGTQSRLITNWLGIPAISTGDMLRSEIQAGTKLGESVRCIMTSGGLVGDELVNEMLAHRVSQPDCQAGFLLDGYPRTVDQAEYLDRIVCERALPKPIILHLDVPLDALVGRLTSRRQCPKCGTIYNLLHQPPKKAGICDNDGNPLGTRKDDQEDVVRERLRTYEAQTRPVLAHYQDRNYYQIRGDRSPGYIFEEITGILDPWVNRNGAGK
jgi:adenylate kinase